MVGLMCSSLPQFDGAAISPSCHSLAIACPCHSLSRSSRFVVRRRDSLPVPVVPQRIDPDFCSPSRLVSIWTRLRASNRRLHFLSSRPNETVSNDEALRRCDRALHSCSVSLASAKAQSCALLELRSDRFCSGAAHHTLAVQIQGQLQALFGSTTVKSRSGRSKDRPSHAFVGPLSR